jgi:demethylmenaquinone methyltransferase/2-methoxy-6-polyprenyl-1,4-benzoquinol methylase
MSGRTEARNLISMDMEEAQLLDRQVAYYRARAGEYDEWFLRQGRYDRGPEHRAEWFAEVTKVEETLRSTVQGADVLELACGTGLWTRHLAESNRHVTAVDASPEVLEINRARVGASNVNYVTADIFSWTPPASFDVVFFAFWLSHVPPTRFDPFWEMVGRALRPRGLVFFVDSLLQQSSTAKDHDPLDTSGIVRRRLNDGREFEIVKVFYDPPDLQKRLSSRGWKGWVRSTGAYFLYGAMSRGQTP